MKKMKKIILIFIFCHMTLYAQNPNLSKYFSVKIDLPISNYNSLKVNYSFKNESEINELVKIDSIDDNISATPSYFSRYVIDDFVYSIAGPEKETTYKQTVQSLGTVNLHPDYKCLLIRQDLFEALKVDLWSFKNSTPINHICLGFVKKNIPSSSLDDAEVIVESKINRDLTIEWHSNEYGFHTYTTYKLNDIGKFEWIEGRTEGEYNGPDEYIEDNLDENTYYVEPINDSTELRGEFVYKGNSGSERCQMNIIYKIDKEGNKRMILCGEKIVMIEDHDGFVNIRKEPNPQSKILYTMPSNKLIGVKMIKDSQWAKVIKQTSDWFDKGSGYIHVSRLKNVNIDDLKNIDYSGY